jgi:hypothetical protein
MTITAQAAKGYGSANYGPRYQMRQGCANNKAPATLLGQRMHNEAPSW